MNEHVSLIVCFTLGCAVVLSPVGCTMHADKKIAQAIAHGTDPRDAYCAHSVQQSGCRERDLMRAREGSK